MSYSPASPPLRAGDYTRFVIKRASTLPPSTGGIVATVFTNDWGPVATPTLVRSFQEYLDIFGRPLDATNPPEGYVAAYNAFKGEDVDHPGAGALLCYRIAGSVQATAQRILAAGATPSALVVTAKYPGTRGNNLKVEVVDSVASPGTKRDIKLYDGAVLLHTFSGYAAADIATLVTDINASASKYFVATGGTNGTILDVLAPTALAGGNDGTTLIAGDWTTARTALEPHPFGYFAPANLTDTSVITATVTWAKTLNAAEKAKRFFLVIGGLAAESYATAAARSAAADDENVLNLGVGTYRDEELGLQLSTAQLAPRLAGVAASRGGTSSLSFAFLESLTILAGPSESEILASLKAGVIVIGLGTGGARIERGVTTFVTTTNTAKPWETYSKVKYVTTMHNFERDGKEANENANILGRLAVNNDTREYIIGREQARLDEYILRKEVQAGARVVLASDPAPSDDDDFIAIDWIGKFSRSLEQIRRTVYFS